MKQWLQDKHIAVLDWTGQNQDLNFIKNLRWTVKRTIKHKLPLNLNEL